MEVRESLLDRALGFAWRWFWRPVWWGFVAVASLYALIWVIGWAGENPERWASALIGGALGLIVWHLQQIQRLLAAIVDQNARLLTRQSQPPQYGDNWD